MATPIADDYAAIAVRMVEIANDEHLSGFAARLLTAINAEAEMQRADEPTDDDGSD
jgi:hypothetical protein